MKKEYKYTTTLQLATSDCVYGCMQEDVTIMQILLSDTKERVNINYTPIYHFHENNTAVSLLWVALCSPHCTLEPLMLKKHILANVMKNGGCL